MKKLASLISIIIIILFSSVKLFAQFQAGDNVRINTPVDDDLYVARSNVEVDAEISGDLFAAGNSVSINKLVKEDAVILAAHSGFQQFQVWSELFHLPIQSAQAKPIFIGCQC